MLIFGKNNFHLKSYTPFELGLTKNPIHGFFIEIRQNYFHLLGIPCFDLGVTWHIRKGQTLTLMPEPYRQQIDASKLSLSAPWRTFSGPIFLMFCLVIFNANLVWKEYQNNRKIIEKNAQKSEFLEVNKPDISENSTYRFENIAVDSLTN
jgi:hypothetical protein